MIVSWEELVNTYGMDVTAYYNSVNIYVNTPAMPYHVLTKNDELSIDINLVIGNVSKLGNY